jgi:hypothetical protein
MVDVNDSNAMLIQRAFKCGMYLSNYWAGRQFVILSHVPVQSLTWRRVEDCRAGTAEGGAHFIPS